MKFRTFLLAAAALIATSVLAAQGQVPGVNSTLNAVFNLVYDNSTMKPTFSARVFGTPTSTPTDVCSMTGSATRTVKVRRIFVGGVATIAINEAVAILKRSTANSAGAGTTGTAIAYDSTNTLFGGTNTTTVALVEFWTGAPTTGTLAGILADVYVFFGTTTTTATIPRVFDFGVLGSPVVLRGVAQQVSVNLEGQGGGSGTVICTFEWTEE